jgi:hypothetical protein
MQRRYTDPQSQREPEEAQIRINAGRGLALKSVAAKYARPNWGWRCNVVCCLLFLPFMSFGAAAQEGSSVSKPAASGNADLPTGPGRDLTVKVCSGCHSPAIAAKQSLSKQEWSDLVHVMSERGAVATDTELDQITDYLAKSFPPGHGSSGTSPSTPAASGNADLPAGPGRDLTVKVCSGCHSPAIVAKQRLSEPEWSDLVQVMSSRGAVATDKELEQITAYLAKSFPADTTPK